MEKHKKGKSTRELAEEYGKPFKTIKNMFTREARKKHNQEAGIPPKRRGRKAAITLSEYKYENKRLKWKTNCCGIFFISLEGSEDINKISGNSSA